MPLRSTRALAIPSAPKRSRRRSKRSNDSTYTVGGFLAFTRFSCITFCALRAKKVTHLTQWRGLGRRPEGTRPPQNPPFPVLRRRSLRSTGKRRALGGLAVLQTSGIGAACARCRSTQCVDDRLLQGQRLPLHERCRPGFLAQRRARVRHCLLSGVPLWNGLRGADRLAYRSGRAQESRRTRRVALCRGDGGQIFEGDRDLPARAQRALQLERLPVERCRLFQIALPARHIPQVAQLKRLQVGAAQLPCERERFLMMRCCLRQVAQVIIRLAQVSQGADNLARITHRTRLRQALLPALA